MLDVGCWPQAGIRVAVDASAAGAQDGDNQQGTSRILFALT